MILTPSKVAERILVYFIILIFLGWTLFPTYWLALNSFKTLRQLQTYPPLFFFPPTLDNYKEVLNIGFVTETFLGGYQLKFVNDMINSIGISVASVAISIVIATPAAYSFARFRFRGRSALFIVVLFTRMVPPLVLVIPLYLLARLLGLYDTHIYLSLTYTVVNIPFVVFGMTAFFQEVPIELEEAAMIDGCTRLQMFRKVLLPVALPGLAATAVFLFWVSYTDFQYAYLLTNTRAVTAPVAIATLLTERGPLWGQISAMSMIFIVPILIFSLVAQKQIAKGMTLGAVKG